MTAKTFILKTLFVLCVFFISLLISFLLIGRNDQNELNQNIQIASLDSDKTWELVQKFRTENNLKTFEIDERLCVIAKDLVNDTDTKQITFRDKYWNYPYRIGQVSIYNAESEDDVVNEWKNTTANVDILKKDWKYSCLVCENKNCAQIFSNFSSTISK